jgi:hypothetical protein
MHCQNCRSPPGISNLGSGGGKLSIYLGLSVYGHGPRLHSLQGTHTQGSVCRTPNLLINRMDSHKGIVATLVCLPESLARQRTACYKMPSIDATNNPETKYEASLGNIYFWKLGCKMNIPQINPGIPLQSIQLDTH